MMKFMSTTALVVELSVVLAASLFVVAACFGPSTLNFV